MGSPKVAVVSSMRERGVGTSAGTLKVVIVSGKLFEIWYLESKNVVSVQVGV